MKKKILLLLAFLAIWPAIQTLHADALGDKVAIAGSIIQETGSTGQTTVKPITIKNVLSVLGLTGSSPETSMLRFYYDYTTFAYVIGPKALVSGSGTAYATVLAFGTSSYVNWDPTKHTYIDAGADTGLNGDLSGDALVTGVYPTDIETDKVDLILFGTVSLDANHHEGYDYRRLQRHEDPVKKTAVSRFGKSPHHMTVRIKFFLLTLLMTLQALHSLHADSLSDNVSFAGSIIQETGTLGQTKITPITIKNVLSVLGLTSSAPAPSMLRFYYDYTTNAYVIGPKTLSAGTGNAYATVLTWPTTGQVYWVKAHDSYIESGTSAGLNGNLSGDLDSSDVPTHTTEIYKIPFLLFGTVSSMPTIMKGTITDIYKITP